MPARHAPENLRRVLDRLLDLRATIVATAAAHAAEADAASERCRAGALNLLHYVGLRGADLRELQDDLSRLGLSSLGRTEAHVLAGVDAPLFAVCRLAGLEPPTSLAPPPVDHDTGPAALRRHAEDLFGPEPRGRAGRIMVTAGTELGDDPALARALVAAGMDVLRINGAHDDAATWSRMFDHVRAAGEAAGRRVRTLFDLAGPKLRTGDVVDTEDVVRWRPEHDRRGAVVRPARVRLVADAAAPRAPAAACDATLPVGADLLRVAAMGDRLSLRDCRGRDRTLALIESDGAGGWIAFADQGAYVEAGTTVRLERGGDLVREGRVGAFPPIDAEIRVRPDDRLWLTTDAEPGRPARVGVDGSVLEPARIPCTLPEVFAAARPGERIWFDDGKIGGLIEAVRPEGLLVRIRHAKPDGSRLAADKGVNLPDTAIETPALTPKDLADLDAVADRADMVGLSFLRSERDVIALEDELDRRDAQRLGLVLKIENAAAFSRLTKILLAALRSPPVGVMIARGDLAVEVGFERLAEVQEEILWICEAAHVPVVWATQVLESLAKKGAPSRAEVTDAAMSARAECVMLNKGPHATDAVRFLDDVLRRMSTHQRKKRAMLRRLGMSRVD